MARKKPTSVLPSRPTRKVGLALFFLAFALRLLFWQATPDAAWPHSAYYKGDAPTWLAYATALQQDQPFELGLPLRPPGNGFLIAELWNGKVSGIATLKFIWCLLGALTVVLLYGAVLRGIGFGAAVVAGLFAAVSTGLMVLSTSLNNETPYLFLVAATLYLWPSVRREGAGGALVRVEHILYFALLGVWQVGERWQALEMPAARRAGAVFRSLAPVVIAFVVVLAPWHLRAWSACRDFNRVEPEVNAATARVFAQLDQALAGIHWDEEARAEMSRMPAMSRRNMEHFVAATMAVRGERRVTVESVQVVDEAFGRRPEPISEHPFVALYGGLNFFLANNPHAPAGFGRGPLDEPPPLAGGPSRYPTMLLAGLPPPDLALSYPPHLAAVNHGYGMGFEWIRTEPGAFLALAGRKLSVFWSGASLGFGGYNLPTGIDGLRRRVDLVVPEENALVGGWRLLWLAVAFFGLWAGRGRLPELVPWFALILTKLVVTVVFFGYARQGASVIPVVGLAFALALGRLFPAVFADTVEATRRLLRVALVVALLFVGLETVRFLVPPTLEVEGRAVTSAQDPWPLDRHEDRSLTTRR